MFQKKFFRWRKIKQNHYFVSKVSCFYPTNCLLPCSTPKYDLLKVMTIPSLWRLAGPISNAMSKTSPNLKVTISFLFITFVCLPHVSHQLVVRFKAVWHTGCLELVCSSHTLIMSFLQRDVVNKNRTLYLKGTPLTVLIAVSSVYQENYLSSL